MSNIEKITLEDISEDYDENCNLSFCVKSLDYVDWNDQPIPTTRYINVDDDLLVRYLRSRGYEVKEPNPFVFDGAGSINYNPKQKKSQKTYLLKDCNTNLYKIGKSVNPLNREKTLQAEKPTYKLLKVWNDNIEKELHEVYKNQRVRGEWFSLNKTQVKYICTHY